MILKFGLEGNIEKFRIHGFNDSSFGNLPNGGSQGAFVIYLINEKGQCSPISWQSKRLKRVVKSAMAAETLVQVECAEACFWIASLLNEILYEDPKKHPLPLIECNTDSRQLHDALQSIRPILDKRLRVDIALLKEMIGKKEISKINWIDSKAQIANSLTKLGASSELLLQSFKNKAIM